MTDTHTPDPAYTPPVFDFAIDMSSRPGSRWRIETYVNNGGISPFAEEMTKKGLFRRFSMTTKRFKGNHKIWLFFRLRDGHHPTDYIETRKLVRLISDQLRPIYWKEGKYGYVISDHAKVLRKWELGTGYVVPVKQLDLPSS